MNAHAEYVARVMQAFGCQTQRELAALLKVGGSAPTNWKERGMSAKAQLRANQEAQRRGIELPPAPEAERKAA